MKKVLNYTLGSDFFFTKRNRVCSVTNVVFVLEKKRLYKENLNFPIYLFSK